MTNYDNKNVKWVDGGSYILTGADDVINVNSLTGPTTFTLPNIRNSGYDLNYKEYFINDVGQNASVNPITIQTLNGDYANGQPTITVSDNGSSIIVRVAGYNQWSVDINANTAPPVPAGGVFGVSDTNGIYTYFSDFQTAINYAGYNGTVEMFANYANFQFIQILTQITINFNGYTITDYSPSGCLGIAPGAGNFVNLKNGNIYKIGGSQSIIYHVDGIINCGAMVFSSFVGSCYFGLNGGQQNNMRIQGADFYNSNIGRCVDITNGVISNCRIGTLNVGIYAVDSIIRNCNAKSTSNPGIWTPSTNTNTLIEYCTAESTSNFGMRLYNAKANHCSGRSDALYGIWCEQNVQLSNSFGWTNTSVGIYAGGNLSGGVSTLSNCTGFGVTGFGLYLAYNSAAYNCTGIGQGAFYGMTITLAGPGTVTALNCTGITSQGEACILNHAGGGYQQIVANCTFQSLYNNTLGAAVTILNHLNAAARTRFSNNACIVANSGAPIFRKIGGGTSQLAFVNNSFQGTAILNTGSFVQVSANVPDAQSNIFNNT